MLMANFSLKKLFTLNICHRAAPPAALIFYTQQKQINHGKKFQQFTIQMDIRINFG